MGPTPANFCAFRQVAAGFAGKIIAQLVAGYDGVKNIGNGTKNPGLDGVAASHFPTSSGVVHAACQIRYKNITCLSNGKEQKSTDGTGRL
jgi:hypothetical protein